MEGEAIIMELRIMVEVTMAAMEVVNYVPCNRHNHQHQQYTIIRMSITSRRPTTWWRPWWGATSGACQGAKGCYYI